jgi:hypothetical protein
MYTKNKDNIKSDKIYFSFLEKINYQKVEVCREFMCDYTKLFINSFLGTDAFDNQEQIDDYIKWCFNNTCKEYKNLYNFDFSKQKKLLNYLNTFSNEIISKEKEVDLNELLSRLIKVINERFDIYKNNKENEIKEFLNLYFLFFEQT